LPPLAEQEAIITEVERRLSVVDEIEAQLEASLKRASRLRQSILKRAFDGRLVPQDPHDEPAELLLQKIRQATEGENGRASNGLASRRRSPRATAR
jgi:type I restriction enzyme S subunit